MMRPLATLASILWLAFVVLMSILAPFITSQDPYQPVAAPLAPPTDGSPLGADAFGRDLWSRMLYAGRQSLTASLLAASLAVSAGTFIGLLAATLGGVFDRLLNWLTNIALSIPGLLLAMLLVTAMGPGIPTVILAVGLNGAPAFAQPARTLFLQLRQRGYVEAASAVGASRLRIAFRHILPNARAQLISLATTHCAWSFTGITTLSFLGLAGDPSVPEWGAMLDAGRSYLIAAPQLAILPGTVMSLTILAIHRLGNWLAQPDVAPAAS